MLGTAGASGAVAIRAVLTASVEYSFFEVAGAKAPLSASVQLGVGADLAAGSTGSEASQKFEEQQNGETA